MYADYDQIEWDSDLISVFMGFSAWQEISLILHLSLYLLLKSLALIMICWGLLPNTKN